MNRIFAARRALGRASVLALVAAVLSGTATAASAATAPEPALLPFAAASPWRLGIAAGATFAPLSDPRNAAITDVAAPGAVWVNSSSYSHPIAWASTSDPLATVSGAKNTGGPWQSRIPATAKIASGTDKHMHVITPDRKSVLEHYAAVRLSETSYTAKRRHEVSLAGSGIGPQNGTRAYGGSAIGGLIRGWEVDPAHPSYTGRIDHPLALAIPRSKLKYTGTDPWVGHGPYDALGYGLAKGYVWPASEQDSNSSTTYSGSIPMGSYFAIPGNVDLSTLGLTTPQALMVAKAAQDYGLYVTDASGASVLYIEDDGKASTSAFRSKVVGPTSTGDDLRRIFRALRVVTSNSATTPNGGPLGSARRGVQAPVVDTFQQPAFAAKVRFQDGAAVPPAGFVPDWGQAYGARSTPGMTYGWVHPGTATPLDLSKNGRVRFGSTLDPKQAGLLHMDWQSSAGTSGTAMPGSWEIAVPDGSDTVTVSVGDAGAYYDSTHRLSVEGVPAVAFTPTSTQRLVTATRTVTVTDGRLTLSQAGGTNTKINYVQVAATS